MHKKWFLFLLFLFTSMTYAVAHAETIVGEPGETDIDVPTDSFAMTALFRWILPFNPLPLKMERLPLFHRTHIPTKNGQI